MDWLVLGPVEVRRDGVPVDLGGARQRAVLTRLLVAQRDVVPVDRLIDDLWAGRPTPSALGVLQAYVSHLRRALEPDRPPRTPARLLVSQLPGYALAVRSDADEFVDRLHEGTRLLAAADPAGAADTLGRALDLWRGEPYADVADQPWAEAEIARLRELRLVAQEHRLAAQLALGQAHPAVAELEQHVSAQPLREGLWRLLALALYRTARQADALDALRRARGLLLDELGLDPSPALRELETAILEQDPALGNDSILTTADQVPEPTPEVARSETRTTVFGRGVALSILEGAARTALGGLPRGVVVTGEAGIGKTWLVQSFAEDLRDQGWRVHWAGSYDASGAPAWWPWLQILDELDNDHPAPAELRALMDGAGSDHPADPQSPGAADARFRQHEAVRRYLVDVSAERPLLLVFDDVHWADAASVQLIADVLTMSRTGRILIVPLTRSGADARHEQSLARLDRVGQRLQLTGLNPDAVLDMMASSGHEVPAQLLVERTGGNPLFVRETLWLIAQSGHEIGLASVPPTVGDVVRQRVSSLSPETQEVLHVAAVLGREVDLEVLLEVSGQDEDEVWDAIDRGAFAGVLTGSGSSPRFAHDLMREALYEEVPPPRRRRLHAKAVEVLSTRPIVDVPRLAEHAHAAGPLARHAATTWSVAAAEAAGLRVAHDDAVRWWQRAAEAQAHEDDADPARQVELLLALLRAQVNAGAAVQARETRNRAVLAASDLPDQELRIRALVALDAPALWLLRQFNEPELGIVGRLERELAALPTDDGELRCRLLATLAEELYDTVPDPRCDELSAQAISMARRLDRPDLLAVALNARYVATNRDGPRQEAQEMAEELVALGTKHDWPTFALLGHHLLASCHFHAGDLERADENARAADRLIRRLDLLLPRMQGLSYWVARRQLDGRFDEAADLLREFGRLGFSWWAFDGLYAGQWLTQRFLTEQFDLSPEPGVAGDLLATAGRARPTLAHDFALLAGGGAGPAKTTWPEPARDWAWLIMTIVRAETVARYGDDPIRQATYDALLPFSGLNAYSASFGAPVDWWLARLATALGQVDLARHHLDSLNAACLRESLDWWAERARTAASDLQGAAT